MNYTKNARKTVPIFADIVLTELLQSHVVLSKLLEFACDRHWACHNCRSDPDVWITHSAFRLPSQ